MVHECKDEIPNVCISYVLGIVHVYAVIGFEVLFSLLAITFSLCE